MTSTVKTPPQISVIVPVFNVAEYLPECLDSIVEQSATLAVEALLMTQVIAVT